MGRAIFDDNNVPTLIVLLNTDGATPVALQADPTTHGLKVNDGATGSDNGGGQNAKRDVNDVPVAMAMSSAGDGTRVALYGDASGNLLIKST